MAAPNAPELLLLYGEMLMGGIDTLIVRMANSFAATGVRCTLVCRGGILMANLDPAVPVIVYETDRDARDQLEQRDRPTEGLDPVVISFDPTSCALALWLDGVGAFGACRQLTGIFHPRAYFLDGEDRLRFAINRLVIDTMPDTSLLFMNEDTRRTHAAWCGRDFAASPAIPLGIETLPSRWQPSNGEKLKIVSVGRLVGFKAYNLGAIPIMQALRDQGIDAEWHFYGSGELEEEMRSRIAAAGLGASIILHGDLRYVDFAAKVSEHDVFIGMGTAALEAGMLGMPVLMAVDGEEDATYGYLQAFPFGNVGERLEQPPRESLAGLLETFHRTPAAGQRALGDAARSVALQYGMDHYCARLIEAGLAAGRPKRFRAWWVGTVYREATTGRTRRLAETVWHAFKRRKPRA
jgi:hypothetical protein